MGILESLDSIVAADNRCSGEHSVILGTHLIIPPNNKRKQRAPRARWQKKVKVRLNRSVARGSGRKLSAFDARCSLNAANKNALPGFFQAGRFDLRSKTFSNYCGSN
jgi:hypothetical protein